MNTEQHIVDPQHPDPAVIERAAAVLRRGGLVAFPTETVYGLGANALDASAIKKIYIAKQRPASDPIIAHIHSSEQLALLAMQVPDVALALADRFWPGALTLILRRRPSVPENIAQGTGTIAVRMPDHPVASALLRAANLPVAAPSANTFTRPSATLAAHVLEDLDGRIDMLLDGGSATIGVESTVLDLSGDAPTVLRPGGVLLDDLRALIPELRVAPKYLAQDTDTQSPGQLLKHYSPKARLLLFTGADHARVSRSMHDNAVQLIGAGRKVGIMGADAELDTLPAGVLKAALGNRDDLATTGQRLFAALRELDAQDVDVILAADPGRDGLGAALWDRLLRAAEGDVINIT